MGNLYSLGVLFKIVPEIYLVQQTNGVLHGDVQNVNTKTVHLAKLVQNVDIGPLQVINEEEASRLLAFCTLSDFL